MCRMELGKLILIRAHEVTHRPGRRLFSASALRMRGIAT